MECHIGLMSRSKLLMFSSADSTVPNKFALSDPHQLRTVISLRRETVDVCATYWILAERCSGLHTNCAASLMLPLRFHLATSGHRHNGRVRSISPFLECDATILSGATPSTTQRSSVPKASGNFPSSLGRRMDTNSRGRRHPLFPREYIRRGKGAPAGEAPPDVSRRGPPNCWRAQCHRSAHQHVRNSAKAFDGRSDARGAYILDAFKFTRFEC